MIVALLCIIIIPIYVFVVVPEIVKIPPDLDINIHVDSADNFYDASQKVYKGEQKSSSLFSYKVLEAKQDYRLIENSFDVKTIAGKPIFKVSRRYAIDSKTGQHLPHGGDHSRSGFLFAPRMLGYLATARDKANFSYWHANYDTPAQMEYRNTTSLYGLEVYHYVSNFSVDQTEELKGALDGVGKDKGVRLKVNLQLWVEPYTGKILKYQDEAEAFYYDLVSGRQIHPWNKFHNETNAQSVEKISKQVSLEIQQLFFIEYWVVLMLVLIMLIAIIWPILISFLNKIIKFQNPKNILPLGISLTVLLLGLLMAWLVYSILEQNRRGEFALATESISTSINNSLQTYANALKGGRGLFDASQSVEREEWYLYVKGLDLEKRYPGVQGLGYAKVITTKQLADYTDSVKKDGYPSFQVTPTDELMVPVTYIEPLDDRNQRALGYNMFSEANRRAAMTFARDSNNTGITGKVTLKQENGVDEQAGFLMYEPVYKPVDENNTLEQRRSAIFGYVYSAFRAKDFMTALLTSLQTDIGIEIFDASSTENLDQNHLLYTSFLPEKSQYTHYDKVEVFNRIWTIRYTSPVNFGADFARDTLPLFITLASILLAISAFFFIRFINLKKLAEEKARIEATLASIGDGFLATDENEKILIINKSFQKILGWNESEVKGKKFSTIIQMYDSYGKKIPESQRLIIKTLRQKVATNSGTNYLQYKRKDGSLLPVAISVSPISIEGNVIGAVEVFRDITKERNLLKRIEEERARIEAVLESAVEGVVVVNSQGEFILFNSEAKRLLGKGEQKVSPEQWPKAYGLYALNEDRLLKFSEIKAFNSLKGRTFVGDKVRVKRADGSSIILHINSSPVVMDKKVIGAVFLLTDVSKQEEVDKAKTEFVSLASHQLRTPLATVKWYAEMLLDENSGDMNKVQKNYLKEIQRGNQRMVDLVNSLLDVSRMELGTFIMDKKQTDIPKLIHGVIEEQRPSITTKKLKVQTNFAGNIPTINIDPKLIHMVFQNLLSNAVKYTPNRGTVSFNLDLVKKGRKYGGHIIKKDSLCVSIKDSGWGIPEEQRGHVFEKLFRADNVKQHQVEGTGLGLYLVKLIIERTGGTVWFDSILNKGTTFFIVFPVPIIRKKKNS